MPYVPVAQLNDYVGKELGRSEWLTIDQARINLFAEATGDHQFIHVDPVKAAQTPFGSTIAHGFLSLSLMPKLMEDILIVPEGLKMAINYGLDSVRFIQPVKVNSKVRLNVTLTDPRDPRSVLRLIDLVLQPDGRIRVIWTSHGGVVYKVFAADDPNGDWSILATKPGGTGAMARVHRGGVGERGRPANARSEHGR
jgi:acyl dehydratase